MADKPTNRERLQEITAGIEQGIKELFESEKYMRYLSVMSKFHRYSVNKYPPAKPGVFHRRAKPSITSGTRHVALVRSASREGLLLAARKRAV